MKTYSLLLASTAVLVLAAASPQAFVASAKDAPILLAQGMGPPPAEQEKKPEQPPAAAPAKPAPPKTAPPKQPPPQPPKPPAPPPAQRQAPPPPPQQPAPPPAAAPKPPAPPPVQAPPPPRTQAPPPPPAPAAQPPARTQTPPPPPAGAPARQERREDRREHRQEQQPTTPPPQSPAPPPAAATQPPPAAAPQPSAAPPPQQPAPQNTFRGPAPGAQPQQAPPPAAMVPSAPPQPRDAREFIRRDNQPPARTMEQVRSERQQTQQGSRTFIREGDRTIVQQDNRTFIRHSEVNRFAIGADDVRVDRRGDQTYTTIRRPNDVTIINITDADGRLIRRVRRMPDGRQVVIIDNSFAGPPRDYYFVDLPPPRIRIPRERYIVDAWDAPPDEIYGAFMAPPVERIERRYTVDEVRYSEPLRARMPRVDLDINFESGSWQLTPEQIDKLGVIADGLNRAISRNPREVFLIEGHTDATGNDEDNLSLSDRRAEAVAVALTEQFQVPAENLVTQGYGEQYLKDPTDGPSRINRRVAVRRITPLIDQQAGGPPPR